MAKITPMWLNSGISGRADRTSNTYTKVILFSYARREMTETEIPSTRMLRAVSPRT